MVSQFQSEFELFNVLRGVLLTQRYDVESLKISNTCVKVHLSQKLQATERVR